MMQTNLLLTLRGAGPLHARVHAALRAAVLDGRLAPGARLPATRALARELGVSRMVVVQAYERLAAEGYLEARVGAGTFVPAGLRLPLRSGQGASASGASASGTAASGTAASGASASRASGSAASDSAAAPRRGALRLSAWGARAQALATGGTTEAGVRLDFRYGRPDPRVLPLAEWRRALRRAASRPRTAYEDAAGSARLRSALAGYLARSRGVRAEAAQLLVCTGSQQALDLAVRVLLDPGDVAVLEEPHYQGTRRVLEAAGARLRGVATDDDGLVPASLPVDAPVRLAVVTPSHQFPSGGVLPLGRRLELLGWARERNAVVVEDDYDGEFRYDAEPVEAIQALDVEQRVIYVGTLSKVLFPGLRLGYLVVPPDLGAAFTNAKWLADRHSPLLEQEALATLIEDGDFERHLRRCRQRYAARREALLSALGRHLPGRVRVQGAAAGLHVVLRFPDLPATRTPALVAAARRRDVGVYPVAPYYFTPPAEAGLILGYGALDGPEIEEGVQRLGAALDDVEGSGRG